MKKNKPKQRSAFSFFSVAAETQNQTSNEKYISDRKITATA